MRLYQDDNSARRISQVSFPWISEGCVTKSAPSLALKSGFLGEGVPVREKVWYRLKQCNATSQMSMLASCPHDFRPQHRMWASSTGGVWGSSWGRTLFLHFEPSLDALSLQSNVISSIQILASPALEATQVHLDGFFSQLSYKCYQIRVASVGD